MLVSLPLHCCSSIWIEINIKLQKIILLRNRFDCWIFYWDSPHMWSWRRRDTSEAIHRILIDATLKAFRARIHGNLRNPISQLLLLRAKTEFYPHPRVVNWKSFARFLFARIWLWKLDSGQVPFEKAEIFCQAKFCIPNQWEEERDQTQSFMWNICTAASTPGLLSTPLEIYFQFSNAKFFSGTIKFNPFSGVFA